jgi:RNA recognition motif-containing protein
MENGQKSRKNYKRRAAKKLKKKTESLRLFIGGFPSELTEQDLISHFTQFGTITKIKIQRDRKKGYSKGYGFITCDSTNTKAKILATTHTIAGRQIDINVPISKEKSKRLKEELYNRKLYIPNLVPRLTENDLINYFLKFGKIKKVYLVQDKLNDESKLIGYVEFFDHETRENVFEEARIHKIGPFVIDVKRYSPTGWTKKNDETETKMSSEGLKISNKQEFKPKLISSGWCKKFENFKYKAKIKKVVLAKNILLNLIDLESRVIPMVEDKDEVLVNGKKVKRVEEFAKLDFNVWSGQREIKMDEGNLQLVVSMDREEEELDEALA